MRKDRKTVTDVNQDPRPRAYKSRSNNLTKSKQEGFKSILARRDTTRGPQTPQTRNELLQQGGIRSLIFIGPLDLPLAEDVPNIDNHKPPTSPQPPPPPPHSQRGLANFYAEFLLDRFCFHPLYFSLR